MSSHGEEFFISTASDTQARAGLLLPTKGTEDASHLLHQWVIDQPRDGVREYLPNAKVDWVVHLDFPPGTVLTRAAILEVFSRSWRDKHPYPDLYGLSLKERRWTFVNVGDAPDSYSCFHLAWKLLSMDNEALSAKELGVYLAAVREAGKTLNAANVRAATSPQEGAARSAGLLRLVKSRDAKPVVVLQATDRRGFDGKAIWDVMLCLGLRWGDMDLFHWENPGVAGDDYFFSVWTSTPPGYFLPEDIAMGQVRTQDLIFGFSVPRTWQPEVVLDSMLRVAHYAKQRLDGRLLDADGSDLSEGKLRAEVRQSAAALAAAGFPCGSDDALYLF